MAIPKPTYKTFEELAIYARERAAHSVKRTGRVISERVLAYTGKVAEND